MKNSELIYKQFVKHSVKHVFGYNGGSIVPLFDQFDSINNSGNIELIVNSTEANCGYAATGYAKAAGTTGVVCVTSGPGMTNTVTPLVDAQKDAIPLIVISGNVPLKFFGKNYFQETDAVGITKSFTKWSYLAQPEDDMEEIINYGFHIANHGKKGSVHIDIPLCVLTADSSRNGTGKHTKDQKEETDSHFLSGPILDIAKVILESERPVLYVGKGANDAYEQVRELSKTFRIPVVTTLHGVGIVDERDALALQMGGIHGSVAANRAIQNADCIISIGGRFDDKSTGPVDKFAPMCKHFVHLNIDESEINAIVPTKHFIVGDVCMTLPLLLQTLNQMRDKYLDLDKRSWICQIEEWNYQYPFRYEETEDLKPQDVLIELDQRIRNNMENTMITTGIGNHQMMACQYINWSHPQRFLTSGSLGAMGTGLPYAIGAQLAFPDRTVIDVDGDGSLMMSINDLKTLAEYNLPVKILVMNNGTLDMVRTNQQSHFARHIVGADFNAVPKYADIAKGFGIKGIACSHKKNLKECMDIFLSHNGPILMDCQVAQDYSLPYVPQGAGLSEQIIFQ